MCTGHQDRDKIGLPRLLEALESTMWSTVTRKPKSEQPLTPPVTTTDSSIDTAAAKSSQSKKQAQEAVDEKEEDEHVFEQLAQAMEQARIIRDRARTENLSDAERRQDATNMILKFAELLGLDEDSSDEEN